MSSKEKKDKDNKQNKNENNEAQQEVKGKLPGLRFRRNS